MARSKQITPKLTKGEARRKRSKLAAASHRNSQQLPPDMISDMSDCILIHILSFLDTRKALRTCILSKRWMNVWKKLPTLVLDYPQLNYSQLSDRLYEQFVYKILSLRDDLTDIHSLQLHTFFREDKLVSHIIQYAFSHNVQHLLLNFTHFPPDCFSFSCPTLKSLKLSNDRYALWEQCVFPNSFNFPALATLSLTHFTFVPNEDGRVEPFSTFNMLNTLILDQCKVLHEQNICISNAKLENLSITMCHGACPNNDIEIYAPNLRTFSFKGNHISKINGSKSFFSSIKQLKINIRCHNTPVKNYRVLFNWLEQFANMESLVVDRDTLQVIHYHNHFFKIDPPSLVNLKSLKIETHDLSLVRKFDEVVSFLLQNSHSVNVENILVETWSKIL